MIISPSAGQPAPVSALIDVSKLIAAYYSDVPDPAITAERVAFGTSGHRGSSFDRTFNENHIIAITEAICLHRKKSGIDGPLFLGLDIACALRAGGCDGAGGARGARRACDAVRRRRVHADSCGVARDSVLQSRSVDRARRRNRDHALAQSAGRWRIQIQSAERRARRHRCHGLDRTARKRTARDQARGREARAARDRAACRHDAPARLFAHIRARFGACRRPAAGSRRGAARWRRSRLAATREVR